MFTEVYMQRALLAGLFLAPVCAFLGVFVTARRMAFFSDTVSHAALAGIALGFWWGLTDPTVPMLIVSLLVAAGMMWLKENTDLLTDTIMALLLSGSVAVGVIILSLLREYRGELHRYLFGDILAVGWKDVWMAGLLCVAVIAASFSQIGKLTLLTAHEEMAHVYGVRVRPFNYLFVVVLTFAVAITIQLLGIILVTSLLVVPAAAARNVSRTLRQQIWFSLIFGWTGTLGGVLGSFHFDVPCGPAVVLTCIAIFLITLVVRRFRGTLHGLPQNSRVA